MNQEFLNEFHSRVGTNDFYFKDTPVFDGDIIGYMRLVELEPYIYRWTKNKMLSDKPVCGISKNYDMPVNSIPWMRKLVRKQRNGFEYKANSI